MGMSFLRDNELSVAVLRRRTDATALGFETTDELDCLKQLIGQDEGGSRCFFWPIR